LQTAVWPHALNQIICVLEKSPINGFIHLHMALNTLSSQTNSLKDYNLFSAFGFLAQFCIQVLKA
jgi:hypothetical protein